MPLLKNIFLAEDDKDDQFLFIDALREIDAGIRCLVANNGKETLDKLKKINPLPDVIFLDLNMPYMNGLECLGKMKNDARLSKVPVVIFTTSQNPADVMATHQLGANVFLTKPSQFSELKNKLLRILNLDFKDSMSRHLAQYSV